MDILINGKKLATVLTELKAPGKKKSLENGYTYYDIDTYENRLNAVIGMNHYVVSYSNINDMHLSHNQICLSALCIIRLIDDEGRECYSASGIGTFGLVFSENSGSFINLNNAGYILQTQAFKSACKSMQIFGVHGDENEPTSDKGEHVTSSKQKKAPKESSRETFFTTGKIELIKEDPKTKQPIYKVYANRKVGEFLEEAKSAIIFYPNLYKKDAELLNNYIALCEDGKRHKLQLSVSRAEYKLDDATQFIFKSFWR